MYEFEKVRTDSVKRLIFDSHKRKVLENTKNVFERELLEKIGSADLIEHCCSRVKENDSIAGKLQAKHLDVTMENALKYLTDLIGVRIVVHFIGDVYDIAAKIRENYAIKEEIDYISAPKENGYRSFHMIVDVPVMVDRCKSNGQHIPVEIQIRTIAMDCWASLEHQMLYKKDERIQMELVKNELINCANTLFSTDMKMEAIQNIIRKSEAKQSYVLDACHV